MKLSDYKARYDALTQKKNLTGDDALAAVRENGYALKYVPNPTEEICLAAMQQNGYALQYVPNPSEAVCLAALEQYGYALEFVPSYMFKKSLSGKTVTVTLDGVTYEAVIK